MVMEERSLRTRLAAGSKRRIARRTWRRIPRSVRQRRLDVAKPDRKLDRFNATPNTA
jgi:hypothetical protein